ncbi:MAG: DUF1127 domain-containing protein [Pseudomonadota bacterium]
MQQNSMTASTLRSRSAVRPASALGTVLNLMALARSRNALAALDADRLADLGLTRDEAMEEAQRPFWDVPAHWRR